MPQEVFDGDDRRQVVPRGVCDEMQCDAVGGSVRRYDAAVSARPAHDERIETGSDVGTSGEERGDVLVGRCFCPEHAREKRRAIAGDPRAPRHQRCRRGARRREWAIGADPHRQARGSGAAVHRDDPRIVRTACAGQHALDARGTAADQRREQRKRAMKQRLIADRKSRDILCDCSRGVGDKCREPQARRLTARPLDTHPAKCDDHVAQRRDTRGESESAEQLLDFIPVFGR